MSDHAARVAHAALPHLDAAYNLARWLVRDPHLAEDVVQEAFARALSYAAGFRDENPRAWLLSIVRRVAYDRLANDRRFVPLNSEDHLEIPDPDPGPEDAMAHREVCARLGELMERLPPELRECLVLREIEEFSYRDIARITGVPVGTVMSRLFRARQSLASHARELVR